MLLLNVYSFKDCRLLPGIYQLMRQSYRLVLRQYELQGPLQSGVMLLLSILTEKKGSAQLVKQYEQGG